LLDNYKTKKNFRIFLAFFKGYDLDSTKMIKDYQKSKAARRKWWKSLTPQQQFDYIEKIVEAKTVKRIQKSKRIMKQYGQKYKCSKCFHGKLGCCTDNLPNGCEYWYNPKLPWSKQGIKLREVA
jgi:hypothetical protein